MNHAYASYQENAILVDSNEKMIEMLYEGIIRFCAAAKRAIAKDDIDAKCTNIRKATAIFVELLNCIDFAQGDVSYYLQGLYSHQINTLSQVIIDNDASRLDEVIRVASGLLEAWREVNHLGLD